MESLDSIFTRIGHFGSDAGHNDKGSTHSYIDSYERLFSPYREFADVLEIGLASGKSLDLWGEYFGPKSTITGVDISVVFDTSRFQPPRFNVIQADATSQAAIVALGQAKFDIIIDDGSHKPNTPKNPAQSRHPGFPVRAQRDDQQIRFFQ